MKKRLFSMIFIFALAVLLVSCGAKTFTVTFDVDGDTTKIASVKVEEDNFLQIPDEPTKEGYLLDYWQETESGEKWHFGKDKVTKDLTLKAIWKEKPPQTFSVKFFTAGAGTPAPEAQEVVVNELAVKPTDPTRDGYIFLGWFDSDDATEAFDFDEPIVGDVTLTARWEKEIIIEYVKVTFDSDGGNYTPETLTIEKNEKATKPEDPEKEGFIFLGWYLGNDEYNFNAKVTKNITLKARWEEEIIDFTVSFDPVIEIDDEFENQVILKGNKVLEPIEPEQIGYIFLGWYKDGELYDFDEPVTEDFVLVAQWQKEHVVIFNLDDEEQTVFLVLAILDGDKVERPEETPTRDFHEFVDWYLDGVAYDFDAPVKDDLVIKAFWEEEEYVAAAYIGEKDYRSIDLAINDAKSGDTIEIVEGIHGIEFTVNLNNLTFTAKDGAEAVITAKITLEAGLNGVTFDGLEFTDGAYIHAPGAIDNFVFINNKVYDSTIEASEYAPNNRVDVNAFIRLYTLAGTDIVGNVTIKDNEFTNLDADVISVARTSVGKKVILEDNVFTNILNSAIRFDGGYNSGDYLIKGNKFENEAGRENNNVILFRAYSPTSGNVKNIDVVNNEFINVGGSDEPLQEEGGYPGGAVIAFSTYNEYDTNINIMNNIFKDTTNTIHLRNNKGNHQRLTVKINQNTFEDSKGFYLFESDYEPAKDDTDFNLNKFIVNGNIITDAEELKDMIINNKNYSELLTE